MSSFNQDNKLTGPASLFAASGERIEFEYLDGVVHGPAKIRYFSYFTLFLRNRKFICANRKRGKSDTESSSQSHTVVLIGGYRL
jgi:hypothetical protein